MDFTLLVYIKGSSTLGKLYGIKPRCYWEQSGECIWEQFENLMGTWWEHFENQGKKQKVPVPLPHPTKKKLNCS
jgi:hypothetical protein